MFGLLRPDLRRVARPDAEEFQATYCNLCGCLSKTHGPAARLLTVFDFASLAWLLHVDEGDDRPRRRLNCVRGGGRNDLRPVDRFLAAISAFTCRVKVEDDLADEGSWQGRLASWTFARTFRKTSTDLAATGFDVAALARVLDEQRDVESRWETDLLLAARPTGRAYAMVARHLVDMSGAQVSVALAERGGEVLGRCVFLVDAYNDFAEDVRRDAYNPLRERDEATTGLSADRESVLRRTIAGWLLEVDTRVASECPGIAPRWIAVRDRVLGLLGLAKSSVTLNCGCIFPCGDGYVATDSKEIDDCMGKLACFCCIALFCMSQR